MEKQLTKPLVNISGYLVALVGLLVVLGWIFDSPELIQLIPIFPPMQFNAAICFILSGLALVLLEKKYFFIVQLISVAVAIIGLTTLVQYLFSLDLQIDNFFMYSGGHMAAGSSAGFVVIGIALFIAEMREIKFRSHAVFLAGVAVSLLGFFGLLGYLFGVLAVSGLGHHSVMAAHSAIAFFVLGLGLKFYSATRNENGEDVSNEWHPLIVGLTQYSIRKKFGVLVAVLFIGLLVLGVATGKRFKENRAAWEHYRSNIVPREQYILRMKELFGYGGGVFYFKTLILRGTKDYEQLAKSSFRGLLMYIDKYWSINNLSDKEKVALEEIRDVATDYLYNVDVVMDYIARKKTPMQIDQQLHIDDDLAFAAFDVLHSNYTQLVSAYHEQSREIRALMFFVVLIAALFTLMVIFIFGHFINTTVIESLNRANDFAQSIAAGDFGKSLEIKTRDEFGQLSESLSSMKTKIESAQQSLKTKSDELERNNQFLNSVFENIPAMVWVKDAENLKYLQLNREGEKILEMPRSSVVGKTDGQLFSKVRADGIVSNDMLVIKTKSLVEWPEEVIDTKSGSKVVNTRKIPIMDERQKPAYLLGISHDITDKKRLMQALGDSEERYTFALRAAEIGTWDWRIKSDTFTLDEIVGKSIGLTSKTFKGTFAEFTDLAIAEERSSLKIRMLESIRTEGDLEHRFRVFSQLEKKPRWISMKGKVYKDLQGKPERMAGIIIDTTDRNQSEGTIELNEKFFSSCMNTPLIGITVSDAKGNISLANDQFLSMLGYTRKDMPLKADKPLSAPECAETDSRKISELVNKGFAGPWEKNFLNKSGVRVPVAMTLTALDPKAHHCLGFVVDLSEKRNLDHLNKTLIHKNQANKREIKQLIKYLDGVVHGDKSKIVKSIEGLVSYFNSKSDDEKYEKIPLKNLVEEVIAELNGDLTAAQATIEVSDLPEVIGHSHQIKTLFKNLIQNAINGNDKGVKISVGGKLSGTDNEFFVKDNGRGMAPETLGQLFLLYNEQMGPAIGERLSLATCRSIVEQNGGRIWVETQPGGGSTFYFTLPNFS